MLEARGLTTWNGDRHKVEASATKSSGASRAGMQVFLFLFAIFWLHLRWAQKCHAQLVPDAYRHKPGFSLSYGR